MGLRFRKSIKLGASRINLSKSGIGYSVGGKGFRLTKKARGGLRTTASIPGTGVSYTKDFFSYKKKHGCLWWLFIGAWLWFVAVIYLPFVFPYKIYKHFKEKAHNNTKNKMAVKMDPQELKFAKLVKKKFFRRKVCNVFLWIDVIAAFIALLYTPYSLIVSIPIVIIIIIIKISILKNTIPVSKLSKDVYYPYSVIFRGLNSERIWLLDGKYENLNFMSFHDTKRIKCVFSKKARVFPFIDVASSTSENNVHIILHPKYLVLFNPMEKFCIATKYSNIKITVIPCNFLENENIPNDSTRLMQTYLYTNKDGSRDKRYKNNPVLNVLAYKVMHVSSQNGLNFSLLISNSSF